MTSISGNYNLSKFPPRNIDPDSYAKEYATKNNISLDEAKKQLKAKYGDPKKPNESNQVVNNIQLQNIALFSLDDTEELEDIDPDSYAKKYAQENNINFEEAKNELKASFGAPEKSDKKSNLQDKSSESKYNYIDTFESSKSVDKKDKETTFSELIKELFGCEVDDFLNGELDPDLIIQKYAEIHNTTYSEAKEEIFRLFGNPKKPDKKQQV